MKLPRIKAPSTRFVAALAVAACCLLSAWPGGVSSQNNLKLRRPCTDAAPATRFDDFELVPQRFSPQSPPRDVNNFLLNPQFGWQLHNPVTGGAPTRDNYPDSIDDKRCSDPCLRDCVGGQTRKPNWDGPLPGACVMCNLVKKRPHRELGHINWFTTTYTGRVCFHNCSYPDMDYTFSLVPDGGAGLTRWNHPSRPENKEVPRAFHIEFDSRETVNRFKSPLWSDFGSKASPCVAKDVGAPGKGNSCHFEEARRMIEQRRAVVVGLFGLDSEHNIYSELHPVYAMAVEVKEDKDDNTWIIFARNTGGEGACSICDHPLDCAQGGAPSTPGPNPLDCPRAGSIVTKLMLLIPPPEGATGELEVSRTADTVFYRNTSACPELSYYKFPDTAEATYTERNQGVLLTFTLDGCEGEGCFPLVEGELHLKWNKGSAAAPRVTTTGTNRKLDACILSEKVSENENGEFERPTSAQAARLLQTLARERQEFTAQMIRCGFTDVAAIPRGQPATDTCSPFTSSLSTEERLKEMRKRIEEILRSKSK